MHETQFGVTAITSLMVVASAVAMLTKWVRLPYTLALVIIGLLISPMHFLPTVHISPEIILLIFLPALLFEAAWNLDFHHLKENLVPILLLAVPGVCVSVGVIGGVLHFAAGLSWGSSVLFGAMISATDPVSVLALFRQFGLPPRLSTVVEGESLFNDGTAAVLFRIVLGLVTASALPGAGAIAASSVRDFALVVFGGLAIGLLGGMAASKLTSYFDDHLLEITLTTVVAYGTYLISESMHVSGVIAVLSAGIVLGNYGRPTGMSPTTQIAVNSFWEYAAFVANSLAFLLIGLDINVVELLPSLAYLAWAFAATLLARFVAVYTLVPLSNRFTEPLPVRWQHVLFWGGLRGSLSIALALSLPTDLPDRPLLVAMIFGVVLFSLLGQGLSLGPLLRTLGFTQADPVMHESEMLLARMACEQAALHRLEQQRRAGLLSNSTYQRLSTELEDRREAFGQELVALREHHEQVRRRHSRILTRLLLDARRIRLDQLRRNGVVSAPVARSLEAEFHKRHDEDDALA